MTLAVRPVLLAMSLLLLMAATVQAKGGDIRLSPQQETGPRVVSKGSGTFSYFVNGNELCYTLEVSNLTTAPVAAHIHTGARKVAGPADVGLTTPPAATSTFSDCISAVEGATGQALSTAELAAIVADPRSFYVNVHTSNYPGGEIRGQLK